MTAIVTTLMGGLIALAGGLVGIVLSDGRERRRWLRDAQLRANTELLGALQLLMRQMINLSYLDDKLHGQQSAAVLAGYHQASVEWNNAVYACLMIVPPDLAVEVPLLDQEVDRLLDLAMSKSWTRNEFRQERTQLGRKAADYLRLARTNAGQPSIDLPSIWSWDVA